MVMTDDGEDCEGYVEFADDYSDAVLQVMVMTALTRLPLPHPTRVLTEGHVIMMIVMEIH